MKPALVWLDFEMTGLNWDRDKILEVAAAVVDDDLRIVSAFHRVLHFKREGSGLHIDPVVTKMHTDNGLWNECEAALDYPEAVDCQLTNWLGAFFPPEQRPITPGGRSVQFDLEFARVHLPNFYGMLSARKPLDLNTIADLNRRAGFEHIPHVKSTHRAMDDVRNDLYDAGVYIRRLTEKSTCECCNLYG